MKTLMHPVGVAGNERKKVFYIFLLKKFLHLLYYILRSANHRILFRISYFKSTATMWMATAEAASLRSTELSPMTLWPDHT